MMPLRERIVRKAKDRAVENLTAISSPAKNSSANKSKRVDRSSYKAFAEQTNLSEYLTTRHSLPSIAS